jgi:hypothetical protein
MPPPTLRLLPFLLALQNTLLNQLFRIRPTLKALLEIIRPHMQIKLPLVSLERRRGRRVGEDVALDKVVASRALIEALLEVVCGTLAF